MIWSFHSFLTSFFPSRQFWFFPSKFPRSIYGCFFLWLISSAPSFPTFPQFSALGWPIIRGCHQISFVNFWKMSLSVSNCQLYENWKSRVIMEIPIIISFSNLKDFFRLYEFRNFFIVIINGKYDNKITQPRFPLVHLNFLFICWKK